MLSMSKRVMAKLGTKKLVAILVAVLAAAAIPVAATVNLFVHQMKPVSAAVVQDNCAVFGDNSLTAMSLPPPSGTGNVLFGCSTPNGAAPLTVRTGGGVVGVWLSNVTSEGVYIVTANTVPCTGGRVVTEKPDFTFTPAEAGDYWYCLEGASSPTPWVDVHWYSA
jgi:hypothetical protein